MSTTNLTEIVIQKRGTNPVSVIQINMFFIQGQPLTLHSTQSLLMQLKTCLLFLLLLYYFHMNKS